MKILLIFGFLFSLSSLHSQIKEPNFEVIGDKVKATYYFSDGSVYKQGFFKNKKLTGEWSEFDFKGNKVSTGLYKNGEKSGIWFQWSKNKLRQINYKNNIIISVSNWKEENSVAIN
tara:strand:+ start:46944 stop:47291 length:348 start_codon:yes stop_codon:yes gene_type:complete